MKNEHILHILDAKIFSEINSEETALILEHAAVCAACRAAYQSAGISSLLLTRQANEISAPPPFFHKRVMANLRERQIAVNPWSTFTKIWKASRALVAMMTVVVLSLVGLTLFTVRSDEAASATQPVFENYSTDMVILDERLPNREKPTNEQIFQILYNGRRSAEKDR